MHGNEAQEYAGKFDLYAWGTNSLFCLNCIDGGWEKWK